MATRRKNTNKIMNREEHVPRGIRVTAAGSYIATSGTGDPRRQPTFDTLSEAIAWKSASDQLFRTQGRTISDEDWLIMTGASAAQAAGAPTVVPISVSLLLDQSMDKFAEREIDDSKVRSNTKILGRFFKECGALKREAHTISGDVAEDLPVWLHKENYSWGHQATLLRLADKCWGRAMRCDHTFKNPFAGLKALRLPLPELDRRGNPRTDFLAPAWTPMQLVAIAFLLRPIYRLPFWTLSLTGLRRSELFGLQLLDWTSETRDLSVRWQRRASAKRGRRAAKTISSRRPVLVCPTLAALIDDYIARAHPPRPTDPAELAEWNKRYLFRGVHGGPMNGDSLCDEVAGACTKLGLAAENVGSYAPLHHLRGNLSALLLSPGFALSGRAVSVYLGHKVAAEVGQDAAALVTRASYSPQIAGELEKVAERIEDWAVSELLPQVNWDLLNLTKMEDGISLTTAARLLSRDDEPVGVGHVQALIQAGELKGEQSSHTGALASRGVVVSASAVTRLLAQRILEVADTYSATDAAKLLGTDHQGLYKIAKEGLVVERASDAGARVAARGFCTGSLPGGGRRFDKAEVDALVASDAEAINRRKTWFTVSEAAARLQVSPDTVRRRADEGELLVWRDPRSTHQRRLLEPASVEATRTRESTVTVAEAAVKLGTGQAEVRALVKLGRLQTGLRGDLILKSSIQAELARPAAA